MEAERGDRAEDTACEFIASAGLANEARNPPIWLASWLDRPVDRQRGSPEHVDLRHCLDFAYQCLSPLA